MIFVGDIAMPGPDGIDEGSAAEIARLFEGKTVVGNLEGSLCEDCERYLDEHVIFNNASILPQLKEWNIKALSLANNHIFDIPGSLPLTKKKLSENQIAFFGAGENIQEAARPAEITVDGKNVTFLGFGWEAIQCEPASNGESGVNPLNYPHVKKTVEKVRAENPDNRLVIVFHWNYELEHYPQPAERQLAQRCIDWGADAVIGGHSHLAQGIEIYKGAPIVYSLGNWAFPGGAFYSGKIRFPERTKLQLAFEWDLKEQTFTCHWFEYDADTHKIEHIGSEPAGHSDQVSVLTPFRDMNHQAYCRWFKKNRNKKKLLPVFKEIQSVKTNRLKVAWVKLRDMLLQVLLLLNLKKMKND